MQSHAIRGKGHWNFNDIGRSIIMSPHRRRLELHGLAKPKNVTCRAQNCRPRDSLLTIANRRLLLQRDWRRGGVLHFLVWAILAALKPKVLLVAENLCLRQQLLVLQRRHPQTRLRNADRQFWICASRWFADWRNSLLIVKPETVLRWHRRGWRAYWS